MRLLGSRPAAVVLVTCATFVDVLAYSSAIPIFPNLGTRLGASPTVIGLLFSAFGFSLLAVSIPMGAVSDRIGRKKPLVAGMLALAAATLMLAWLHTIPWLFVARLMQGAADAVTWVVGFALLADLYGPTERGRVMGSVISATTVSLMIGPPFGGWLYEMGGMTLPFVSVALLAAGVALAFAMQPDTRPGPSASSGRMSEVLLAPAMVRCAFAAAAAAATLTMIEPVWPLFLDTRLGLHPAEIGLLFGIGAVTSAMLHPWYGRLSDRFGGRRLTVAGLLGGALAMPLMAGPDSMVSAAVRMVLLSAAIGLAITPSLSFIAEAASAAGVETFGVVYGIYNVAWGAGVLVGPALGGFLYERIGFQWLCLVWAPCLVTAAWVIGRARLVPAAKPVVEASG
ncbi:MAG: MFS transporter [Acidobacteria bacterium]|nr:MFS transporter [Acidobacteriota bacterium]